MACFNTAETRVTYRNTLYRKLFSKVGYLLFLTLFLLWAYGLGPAHPKFPRSLTFLHMLLSGHVQGGGDGPLLEVVGSMDLSL